MLSNIPAALLRKVNSAAFGFVKLEFIFVSKGNQLWTIDANFEVLLRIFILHNTLAKFTKKKQ